MIEDLPAWVRDIALLAVPFLTIFGFYLKGSDRAHKTESAAGVAAALASALQLKVETLQKELSDFKVEAASKFVSDKELFQAEDRFRSLVEGIKADIRGVTERLDRVLENQAPKQ